MNKELFFSLTTIPSRFKNIYPCIDSLLNQLVTIPYKIIINIPENYSIRFNNQISNEDIEEFLKYYNYNKNIIINRCKFDYGPGTKLIGILKNKIKINDAFIVLVDDDVIYDKNFLNGIYPYLYDNIVASYWVYNIDDIKVGQGVDGLLIDGKLLKEFLKYYKIIKDEKYINFHDDIYISFYFYLKKINIEKISWENNIYVNYNNIESLSSLNGDFSREIIHKKVHSTLISILNKGNFNCILPK
jgi:hypothetical protein